MAFIGKTMTLKRLIVALLLRLALAGWASVEVFILPGSSRATDEIRSGTMHSRRRPIWVQP